MKYQLRYSETALEDIRELRFVIRDIYKAPNTAIRYLQGLYDEISRLKIHSEYPPIQISPFSGVTVPMQGASITKKWQLYILYMVILSIFTALYLQI